MLFSHAAHSDPHLAEVTSSGLIKARSSEEDRSLTTTVLSGVKICAARGSFVPEAGNSQDVPQTRHMTYPRHRYYRGHSSSKCHTRVDSATVSMDRNSALYRHLQGFGCRKFDHDRRGQLWTSELFLRCLLSCKHRSQRKVWSGQKILVSRHITTFAQARHARSTCPYGDVSLCRTGVVGTHGIAT